MIIDRVDLHHLRMTLRAPFETSFGRIDARDCILLEVFSDGEIGLGECAADRAPLYTYENVDTAWHILKNFIVPAILGNEVKDSDEFQRRVKFVRGHNMAKAGLEMGWWDLRGKQKGKSLRELFGGEYSEVKVGVSIGIKEDPQELLDVAENYLEKGYERIKIKIKPGRDVEETRLLRKAYPGLKLQVDANSAYTLDNSKSLEALDDLELLLIEQPLAEDDLWDHSQLQSRFKTPICLDESIHTLRHARQALDMKACRIINIKAGRVGGLGNAISIHDLCLGQGIPVWCGGMLETGVGRASNLALASLPGFALPGDISASDRYYHEDIIDGEFTLNSNSTITVPNLQGLGVSLDRPALKRATVKSLSLSI
ncbi:MAG: o-succinylbenzoate synthase [Chloroflexi bacterium]|nr:o-succinylbenzoate synthase [Chloroflexota bacterium]